MQDCRRPRSPSGLAELDPFPHVRCPLSVSLQAWRAGASLGLGFWQSLAWTAELHGAGGGSQFGYALRRALATSAACLLFARGLAAGSDTGIRARSDISAGTIPQARAHARVWLPLPQRRMRVLIHRRIDGRTVRQAVHRCARVVQNRGNRRGRDVRGADLRNRAVVEH